MELPHIGEHCAKSTCNKLDFLPVTCNLCSKTFCSDHSSYTAHSCSEMYRLDAQVPVCPMCDQAIPFKRGQPPDIAVNEHMENNCQVKKTKVYVNKCNLKGCKNKEYVSVMCDVCKINFCLKHRHTTDHNCQGEVAARREKTLNGSIFKQWFSSSGTHGAQPNVTVAHGKGAISKIANNTNKRATVSSIQGNMSESAALAAALQASHQPTATPHNSSNKGGPSLVPPKTQEEEDRALAQALALSMNSSQAQNKSNSSSKCSNDCSLS